MILTRSVRAVLLMGLALGYWLAIFALTHLPSHHLPRATGYDKLHHAAAFGGLAMVLCLAASGMGRAGAKLFLIVILLGAVYGGIDELTQQLVPGRTADFFDWLADVAGLLLGIGIFQILRQLWTGGEREDLDAGQAGGG